MKIAVIGGGASGLTCAVAVMQKVERLNKKAEVTVFESKDRVGKKLLATGNGRCNMMNTDSTPFYFSKNNFHSFAIEKYNCASNLEFFSQLGVYTRTDEEGRVYPLSNQASTVLESLRVECDRLGVKILTGCEVTKISPSDNGFLLNDQMFFDRVVLSCGGKALVKNFNGYDLLSQLNHKLTKTSPSLTKLNLIDTREVKQLQGIRHKARLTLMCDGKYITEETGELLFAKYGLSGIAIMQLSAYITRMPEAKNKSVIYADFAHTVDFSFLVDALKKIVSHNNKLKCENLLSGFMPKMLSSVIVKSLGINPVDEVGTLKDNDIINIAKKTKKYPFEVKSVCSFEDAQVTAGGADTSCFDEKTMESRLHKGFYAIGEVLDVDGLCGGYNLMWAWSSARLCADSMIK